MKKKVFGRQLKRDTNERKALFKGLASSLVMHESIQTTEEKAKAIRSHVEKLVTKAKTKDGVRATSLLMPYLSAPAVKKMIQDLAPRFATRPGGYTRIVRLGNRFSDNASVVMMEWVEKRAESKEQSVKSRTKKEASAGKETVEATTTKAKAPAKKAEKRATKTEIKKPATKTAKAKKESK
jgi:large subunit ribosomal protein L17